MHSLDNLHIHKKIADSYVKILSTSLFHLIYFHLDIKW